MAATETGTRAHAALDVLYRRHVGDVYRYTYAVLGNHADAEDVTQTTFVNALRALERGEEPQNPSNWLLAIAHNVVRQRWRQAAARPSEVELVHDVPEATPDEEVELDGLVRALQRIPPAQREALVMRELEGRSYREIAELLGMTTSALETLLFRARRSLAEELENLVTCQNAELAISRQLDERLSRKERRRLEEHLAECEDCARLAAAQRRQRRAFKGLALLPIPASLALFKGAPAASAAALPTIGLAAGGATGTAGAGGVGTASAAGVSATSAAASAAGGAAVGGSLVGGAVAKVAAVVVAASVATGVGYEGVKAVRDSSPAPSRPAVTKTAKTAPTTARSERGRTPTVVTTKRKATSSKPATKRQDKVAPGRAKRSATVGGGHGAAAKTQRSHERKAIRGSGASVDAAPAPKIKPKKRTAKAQKSSPSDKPKKEASAAAPPSTSEPPATETAPVTEPPAPTTPSDSAPAVDAPATAPVVTAPPPPAAPSTPADGSSSGGRSDNGNHNGWDNANKDEKTAAKA